MIVVSDAGPLITLFDGGEIGILHEMFEVVLIPNEVFREVFESGRDRRKPSWMKVGDLVDADCLAAWAKLRQVLDAGEAEAIPLAMQQRAPILIDDQTGRAQCEIHGLEYFSLHAALSRFLKPKRCRTVLANVRSVSGAYIVEPEF